MTIPSTETSNVEKGFIYNELDAVDLPTYHFKLYMIPEEDFFKGKIDSDNKIVISESAVTAATIDDVTIKSVPGISQATGPGTSTIITFTIKQPHGASLLDDIYNSAAFLGIRNYQKAPYFLELTFKGRGTNSSSPLDSSVGDKKWVWNIFISNVITTVDSAGSVYEFTCASVQNSGSDRRNYVFKKNVSAKGNTVKTVIDEMVNKLNSGEEERKATNQKMSDTFEIDIDSSIADLKLTPDENVTPVKSVDFGQSEDLSVTTVHFNDGTTLYNAIDAILASTSLYQEDIKASDSADSNPVEDKNETKKIFKKLYRIWVDVELLGYDTGREDYAKAFKYKIIPYSVSTALTQSQENVVTTETSSKRAKSYIDKKVLRKEYSYIFTGLNDQVIDFDIKFNFGWFAGMPRQGGFLDNYVSHDVGKNIREKTSKELKTQEETMTKQNKFGAKVTADNTPKSESSQSTQQGSATTSKTKPSLRATYAADITFEKAQARLTELRNSKILQHTSFTESDEGSSVIHGVEGSFGPGRSYLSAIYGQVMKSAEHMKIDLSIKGDPYWLQPSPYKVTDTYLRGVRGEESSEANSSINYISGQHFILFTARTPIAEVVLGDGKDFSTSTMLSGVYTVITVDSEFNQGVFTQTLLCTRDTKVIMDKATLEALYES